MLQADGAGYAALERDSAASSAGLGPEALRHAAGEDSVSRGSAYVPPDYDPEFDAEPELEEPLPRAKRGFRLRSWRAAGFVTLVLIAGAITLAAVIHSASGSHTRRSTFFVLTDMHLDGDYNASCSAASYCRLANGTCAAPPGGHARALGQVGCDSPMALVRSAVGGMKAVDDSPAFVLMTGDFIAHDHTPSMEYSLGIVSDVTRVVREAFPESLLLPALGNNDAVRHWCGTAASDWLGNLTAGPWDPLLSGEARRTFLEGGYYSVHVEDGLHVAVLNTVLYAEHFRKNCVPAGTPVDADPHGQLAWFEGLLRRADAAGERVLVAGHVPAVVNPFQSHDAGGEGVEQWQPDFVDSYLKLLRKYPDTVAAQFFAHLHRDGVRSYYQSFGEQDAATGGDPKLAYGSVLLSPSVSPVYQNNPSFRRYHMETSDSTFHSLRDYDQYFMDLEAVTEGLKPEAWELEYSFRAAYMNEDPMADVGRDPSSTTRALDSVAVAELVRRLFQDSRALNQYLARSQVQWRARRDYELCALALPDQDAYAACHGWRTDH